MKILIIKINQKTLLILYKHLLFDFTFLKLVLEMSNSIEKLVGQLIIAGFRNKSIKNDSPIVNYIKNFNLAGVILYDIDLEIGGKDLTPGTRNIESPTQLKRAYKASSKYI